MRLNYWKVLVRGLTRDGLNLVGGAFIAQTWAVFFLLLASGTLAFPQDALRHSMAGEQAARARAQSLEAGDYNLRLGDARFLANASLGMEYNDNVRLNETATQKEDFIFSPRLNTSVHWPVTVRNALNFSLGLGYQKYISQSQYDYLIVTPGSQLSFDLFVKDFRITFYDQFSYTQNPLENGDVSGVARYGGLDNSAGLNIAWDLNEAIVTAGYAHRNFMPDQDQFDYLTRASELFVARAAFLLESGIALGPEATTTLTAYETSFLNDSFSYSAGAFADVPLSRYIRFGAHAGFVSFDFESGGVTAAPETQNSYYFNVDVAHTVNEFMSHSLSGGRTLSAGTFSDFQERYFARYSIAWKLIRNLGLGTDLFYENAEYPPVIVPTATGSQVAIIGDSYERFGAGVNLSYRLMRKLSTTLAYRYTLKESGVQTRDYKQNSVTLGLTYQF